ncbi:MAG: ferredoxin family protein [Firmicutes bacterium]|nr:ferredoxin family protein [Bacillota bacterium]
MAGQRRFHVTIRRNYCKQCSVCVEFCPTGVFDLDVEGYPVPARTEACTGCHLCVYRCPDFALDVEEKTAGE